MLIKLDNIWSDKDGSQEKECCIIQRQVIFNENPNVFKHAGI